MRSESDIDIVSWHSTAKFWAVLSSHENFQEEHGRCCSIIMINISNFILLLFHFIYNLLAATLSHCADFPNTFQRSKRKMTGVPDKKVTRWLGRYAWFYHPSMCVFLLSARLPLTCEYFTAESPQDDGSGRNKIQNALSCLNVDH